MYFNVIIKYLLLLFIFSIPICDWGDSLYLVKEIWGPCDSAYFGASVTGIEDLNHDGYDDMAVGSPFYNLGGACDSEFAKLGIVYIYFGDPNFDTIPSLFLKAPEYNEFFSSEFGSAIAGKGDFQNDDLLDIAVGAPRYMQYGRVYIYLGKNTYCPGETLYADTLLKYDGPYSIFGGYGAVLSIGNFDGDLYSDLLIQGPGYNWPHFHEEIKLGESDIFSEEVIFDGDSAWAGGAACGDVNNDWNPDIAIVSCSSYADTKFINANICYGGSAFDTLADIKLSKKLGFWVNPHSGMKVIGDLNGDGYNEIVIKDPRNDEEGINAGKIYIYSLQEWGVGESAKCKLRNVKLEVYPNPFLSVVSIKYSVIRKQEVSLELYDIAGRPIRTLVDEEKSAGKHTSIWDGRDNNGKRVRSGVYFAV